MTIFVSATSFDYDRPLPLLPLGALIRAEIDMVVRKYDFPVLPTKGKMKETKLFNLLSRIGPGAIFSQRDITTLFRHVGGLS